MIEALPPESLAAAATRRQFLLAGSAVAGGFVLGWTTPARAALAAAPAAMPQAAGSAAAGGAFLLTDWVRVTRDDVVTLVVSQAEMGQGISTTLPALIADELGADWSRIRLELAPTAAAYQNPRFNWQFTGNSESTQSFHDLMRKVGAGARTMLTSAAAQRFGVPAAELGAENGRVLHSASGRSASFGELAEDAARLPPPSDPVLRPAAQSRLIGKALPRVDGIPKANGSAIFGIDHVPDGLDGLAFAAIRSAPAYDGRPLVVKNMAALKARAGVIDVVMLPAAVAVVADRYWRARAALAAAEIEFDAGSAPELNSAGLRQLYRDRLENGPFKIAKNEQPKEPPGAAVAGRLDATYELGYQAHATLEPMNALARVTAQGVDIWAPTQGQDLAKYAVADVLQVNPETVRVFRSPFLGGGFGRRLLPDFAVDAALLARAVGRPVKVIWSREEDFRRDFFRPATLHLLQAEVDAQGQLLSITQRLVSPSILKAVFPPLDLSGGIDPSSLEGTLHTRYRIPGWRTEFHLLATPVPASVYRTTGFGPAIFGLESFIDELAQRAKQDPYRYRRALLAHDPRALRVLDTVAAKAGWTRPLSGAGKGRGIAFTEAFDTVLAQVVEVTVKGRQVRIDRIVTAADPGRVLDPKITEAGLEGGAIWALSSMCKGEITFDKGGPVQSNFHEYDLVRLRETPRFETHLLESPGEKIGGVGEVGPVATAPALANAIFAATGKRLRTLPLARNGFGLA